MQAFAAQESAQEREEGKEVPTVEKIEDNEPTVDIIPVQDLEELDQTQEHS